MRDFLTGAQTLPGTGGKPRLYCSSRLWARKDPGDIEQGPDGKRLPDDSEGPRTIRRKFTNELSGDIDNRPIIPYWADSYNTYLLWNDQGGQYYCDDPDRLAVTDDSPNFEPSMYPPFAELRSSLKHVIEAPCSGNIRCAV